MTTSNPKSTLGWGIFCACSWTWCIGMFLPIIMLSRWGWPGFLVFAIPNVLGCAAFGYVIRNPLRSQQLVARHAPAMKWFSFITITFHVFFIGFACRELLPEAAGNLVWLPLVIAPGLLLVSWAISAGPWSRWPTLAVFTYAVSLVVFAQLDLEPLNDLTWSGTHSLTELPWVGVTIVFGFLLCPYLDPTFHRALQRSGSPHAFGVFGAAFAVMLLLTCVYATLPDTKLTWLIGAHLVVQGVFTMAAHLRELRALSIDCCRWKTSVRTMAPLVVLPLAYVGVFFEDGYRAMEDTYIRFLVFYGLAFPAYVLLFMGPLKTLAPGRKSLIILGGVVLLGAPIYEAGYLHGVAWLMPIPLVVLVSITLMWGRRNTA